MEKLNFYTVNMDYVKFLNKAEHRKRGLSGVPNMEYEDQRKPKFLCGVVLQVNSADYLCRSLLTLSKNQTIF